MSRERLERDSRSGNVNVSRFDGSHIVVSKVRQRLARLPRSPVLILLRNLSLCEGTVTLW
jgi:hypothetical protein